MCSWSIEKVSSLNENAFTKSYLFRIDFSSLIMSSMPRSLRYLRSSLLDVLVLNPSCSTLATPLLWQYVQRYGQPRFMYRFTHPRRLSVMRLNSHTSRSIHGSVVMSFNARGGFIASSPFLRAHTLPMFVVSVPRSSAFTSSTTESSPSPTFAKSIHGLSARTVGAFNVV